MSLDPSEMGLLEGPEEVSLEEAQESTSQQDPETPSACALGDVPVAGPTLVKSILFYETGVCLVRLSSEARVEQISELPGDLVALSSTLSLPCTFE